MIGRLTGRIAHRSPGAVVLEVAGVGYDVRISLQTFYAIPEPGASGGAPEVTLLIHTHVREDQITLFGFDAERERALFRDLIGISGIGPRVGLAILSGIGVEELRAAVESGDRARLQRIPGVGRKTAERVLLEMKDRLCKHGADEPAASACGGDEPRHVADAVSALINLGYSDEAARKAVDAEVGQPGEPASAEGDLGALIRASLRRLVR